MTSRDRVLSSAIEAIGGTPLVELTRLGRDLDGSILAKLEYLNPGFSKKDRIAKQIIEDAEADGRLRPGQTVVELTSGNTGTGLAIVCRIKGYPFVAVMSTGNSMERARMMRALAADAKRYKRAPVLGFLGCMAQSRGKELIDRLRVVNDRAIGLTVKTINAESPGELQRIATLARARGTTARVALHLEV